MNTTATGTAVMAPASVNADFNFVAEQTINNAGTETISGGF
jgi:hypothetical protein